MKGWDDVPLFDGLSNEGLRNWVEDVCSCLTQVDAICCVHETALARLVDCASEVYSFLGSPTPYANGVYHLDRYGMRCHRR
ncbi:uncharacterized protein BDV17DRAFT_223873 [Aspergillus undulatus]|uniref:uncharacterized protein n=1 Tax=Aspergillus undulatus TaxID=1810928 RepID=UPI003CCDFB78